MLRAELARFTFCKYLNVVVIYAESVALPTLPVACRAGIAVATRFWIVL